MFNRIFGGTDAEQMQFLQTRSVVTIAAMVVCGLLSVVMPGMLSIFALLTLFLWGWNVIKGMFGITTIGAIFSGNLIVGLLLFVVYLIMAYFVGIVFAFLGVGRWIYLKAKGKKV